MELVKQTNSISDTSRPTVQLSKNNEIRNESLEHCQNIHQTSSLFPTTTDDSSLLPRKTTLRTKNSSSPDVNHLEEEENALMNVASTIDILQEKQNEQLSHIDVKQVIRTKEQSSTMDSDTDSTDDTELFKTLSEIHGIINPSADGINQVELFPSSSPLTSDMNEEEKCSSDLNERNEMELSNSKEQVRRPIIFSSPFVINTIKQSDEEREEKSEKNILFHKNHNDVDEKDKQKENDERKEEKKEATAASILFANDSHSPIVLPDFDASYSLPYSLFQPINTSNRSTEVTNQLDNHHWQIASSSKINMTHRSDDDQQTTTNLFDPFAPTTTTTMNVLEENEIQSQSNQPLANYNFDDLWNQSMSDMDSSNKNQPIDSSAFTWDSLVNNETGEKTNLTWENLFGEEKDEKSDLKEFLTWILDHFNDLDPDITFTSTQNLESIVKDIQMSTLPFEPIPSPPLHVDHTVSNPLINAIHHDLFPIDELEQPNINPGPQSMILYEEDEEEEEEENPTLSFDEEVKPIVDQLVADALQLALTELNEPYQPVEHFIDQILTQAIYEIYEEEQGQGENELQSPIPTENLASIINWHDQTQATNKQLPDPFDSVWTRHFQAPDDPINENLFQIETKQSTGYSHAFDDIDLFSSSSNPMNKPDESEHVLSEYLPPLILTNSVNPITETNKYTLTAPVMDDSEDDGSSIEEFLMSRKVII